MKDFKHDQHHINDYKRFSEKWGGLDLTKLVTYYDIYELTAFLPPNPSDKEKEILQKLIGTTSPSGYLDYQKSNNTFELIMQWREMSDNLGNNENFLER